MARKDIINQDGTPNWDAIAGFKERLDGHDSSLTGMTNGVETNDLPDYRGINVYGKTFSNAFATSNSRTSTILNLCQQVNANMVIVIPTAYQANGTSATIGSQVQPTSDIINFCTRAKSMGFQLCVKPYVECTDGTWRANIAPSDVAGWFSSFKSWLVSLATTAQSVNAEVFCLGAEMISMSAWTYRSYWVDIISSIRAVFTGKLTYGANGNGDAGTDEIYSFCFIDLIDFVGIDLYPQLTQQAEPPVNTLLDAWFHSYKSVNYVDVLESWALSHGKPVILNEIGCPRVAGANQSPATWFTGAIDNQEQANFITAMFGIFHTRCTWLKGLWWWALDNDPNDGYTFENEPCLTAMKTGFTSQYKGGV